MGSLRRLFVQFDYNLLWRLATALAFIRVEHLPEDACEAGFCCECLCIHNRELYVSFYGQYFCIFRQPEIKSMSRQLRVALLRIIITA